MALTVRDITFSLSLDNLDAIRTKYDVPNTMAMVVPGPDDRACSPPDGFITVYEVHLKGELCFPVSLELYHIMIKLGVPFVRLQPNTIRYLVSLCVFARCHKKVLEVLMMKIMFHFTHNLDWITMTPRPEFAVMSGGNPNSTKR
ncbi:hypothetical protein Nepgr_010718 [Nepenthes gracilis]|uniref:Uncharacterized protein n=1 Tax=Nepenthes gracilis TaxID=150966 RepID=A0AAD3XLA8_NEPGR|nr:hypothetical protein Nepgr_010718 [Nepenthes gracilis]